MLNTRSMFNYNTFLYSTKYFIGEIFIILKIPTIYLHAKWVKKHLSPLSKCLLTFLIDNFRISFGVLIEP